MTVKKSVWEWLEEDDYCIRECLEECVTDTVLEEEIDKEEYERVKEICLEADTGREACIENCYEGWWA